MPNTQLDEPGQTHTDFLAEVDGMMAVYAVLTKARISPFTTKSDFARMAANEIALCASDGLISTRLDETTFSNTWMLTPDGFHVMEEIQNVLSSRH